MQIHNVDLHYHAGQERQTDVSLFSYLEYAQNTGRRILGVTDHYSLYFPRENSTRTFKYTNSFEGLIQYNREVEELKSLFPALTILFAPEMGPRDNLDIVPSEIIEKSDYFICEPLHSAESAEANTESMIKRLREVSVFIADSGKPAFLAHPFRSSVNNMLIKNNIHPQVTEIGYRDHWSDFDYDELCGFFKFDIKSVAKAACELGIAIEINGNTQYRIRSSNLPAVLQMLWTAYKVMADEGAEFVPGSDLHGFVTGVGKIGQYVPYDCFEMLGIKYDDIKFIDKVTSRLFDK